jgi:hypothetical protein
MTTFDGAYVLDVIEIVNIQYLSTISEGISTLKERLHMRKGEYSEPM